MNNRHTPLRRPHILIQNNPCSSSFTTSEPILWEIIAFSTSIITIMDAEKLYRSPRCVWSTHFPLWPSTEHLRFPTHRVFCSLPQSEAWWKKQMNCRTNLDLMVSCREVYTDPGHTCKLFLNHTDCPGHNTFEEVTEHSPLESYQYTQT